MGSSGRPLFDLNELPDEDEADFPSNSNCDDLQPAIDSLARTDRFPSVLSNPGVVAGHTEQLCSGVPSTAQDNSDSSAASLSHRCTVAPFQPGQHPLSCFKPFSVFQPVTKPLVTHRSSADNGVSAKESKIISTSNLGTCKPKVVPVVSVSATLTANAGKEGGGEVAETAAELLKARPSDGKNAVSGKVKPATHNLPAEVNESGHDDSTAMISEDCSTPSLEVSGKLNSDGFIKLVADSNKESPAETPIPSNTVSSQENVMVDDQIVQKLIQPNQQQSLESKLPPILGKRRSDLKDAMLGKKRNRQTVFLDIHEVKQVAPPLKTPTRRSMASLQPRAAKDSCPRTQAGEISVQQANVAIAKDNVVMSKDSVNTQELKKEPSPTEGLTRSNSIKQANTEDRQRQFAKPLGRRHVVPLVTAPPVANKPDERQPNPPQRLIPVKKGPPNYRKQAASANFYSSPDSSKERLHREATCDRLWRRAPGEAELRRVPGSFESVEEYVRVFEPLLFEECRAQLHNTWEELSDSVSKDAHMPVSIKVVERRERGWYDAVLIPLDPQAKLNFKEGDVAVLSTPKPSSVGGRSKKTANGDIPESAVDSEMPSRIAGIVRRYFPLDTRDLPGAVLHFHLGESATDAATEKMFEKFQIKTIVWYLTVLGSLATTQREYLALNSFHRLHTSMINSILQPKPDLFPRYENGPPPAMPECFTSSFSDHLHRTFNEPQLAAIKWAAMHTADESNNSLTGSGKRQEPWSFSLVQGPPGTGKTHTVWGMLNVIHLVQYQRYYTALLRKLAPGSVKSTDDNATRSSSSSSSSAFDGSGSIDEVLQKMDESLARVLPKLCPKPRMLVCAPSNAATDELLTRVLERGFIDGEMKVYRPDVARVGVDSQSRAAQAVSVERRSDQLLSMGRDDVIGWIQQLRGRELGLSQRITLLQRELGVAAAANRVQGTLGVDPEVLVARDQSRDSRLQELARIVEERDKVLVEMSRLLITESRFRSGSLFSLDDVRNRLEASFAKEAEVVFTTVSSSGRRLFNSLAHSFDMVVIDEAAQASEIAVLPPLSLGAARCVLVGDPQQLPATVISRAADTLQYSRSLFERFQQAGCPTLLLSVQYRMHPQIRDFPSRYFYQARLLDSNTIKSTPDEAYHKDPLLRPYLFYDISHGRESHHGGSVSYQNILEAQFAARLYEYLQSSLKAAGLPKVTVGVITPYKLQLKCLQQEFEPVLNSEPESKGGVYINTVDAFQGQERDVIIMSCVRASSHGVGFVADIRRMNVALTRARRALWIMGNALALAQSEDWAALIADAKERNCFVSMENADVKALLNSKSSNVSSSQGRSSGGILCLPKPHGFPKGSRYQSSQSDACASQSRGGGSDKQQPAGLKLQQQGLTTEDYKNEKS